MTTKAEVYMDLFILLIILAFVLTIIKFVIAQPNLPHQFYGTVTCPDGSFLGDGTKVSVKLQGMEIKSTLTSSGTYGYSPAFLIWESQAGESLDFYVSDLYYISVPFSPGTSQKLDIATSSCPSSGGGSSGGGGGGGTPGSSSGGSSIPSITPPKSIIFEDSSPVNPANPNPQGDIYEFKAPNFSNYFASRTARSPPILALDISILSLLILSVVVLVMYTKIRSKSFLKHQV